MLEWDVMLDQLQNDLLLRVHLLRVDWFPVRGTQAFIQA
jgi:hypothetical protein